MRKMKNSEINFSLSICKLLAFSLIFSICDVISLSAEHVTPKADHKISNSLAGSEILSLLPYDGTIPKTLEEWRKLVELGEEDDKTIAFFVPFSASPSHTNLAEPRLVMGVSSRLFFGLIPRKDGTLETEFISWNENRKEFDFGVVKDGRLELANRNVCLQCHKTEGPIFSKDKWRNTTGAREFSSVASVGLAKAMLTKQIQLKPEKYGKYKNLLTEKTENPAIFDNVTIGDFPIVGGAAAAFFEKRVESANLLFQYHLMSQAMSAEQRKELARLVTERALSLDRQFPNVELREKIESFVKNNRSKLSSELITKLNQSPIFGDFSPGLDFDLPADHPAAKLPKNSVERILAVSDYLEKEKKNGYPDHLRPFTSGALAPKNRLDPAGNGLNPSYLFGSSNAFIEYRKELKKLPVHQEDLYRKLTDSGIYSEGHLPRLDQLKNTIDLIIAGKPVPKDLFQTKLLDTDTAQKAPKHSCLGCHDGSIPGLKMPVDPTKESEWSSALAEDKTRANAAKWLKKIIWVLEDERMPPPDVPEAVGFDGKALLKMLKNIDASITK